MARLLSIRPARTGFRNIGEIEEVPDAVRRHDATLVVRACACASRAQARSILATASEISSSPIINGGRRRTTLSPAPTVSNFSAAQLVDHFGCLRDHA
jgi:hypothetical protein